MDAELQTLLFMFFGGLGIFLFGIKYMGDGLQKVAGERLRDLLDKFTTNPLMGVLAGIVVTVLLQTSTGTTVLTIGLVNAGFMTLKQAIGVIMGANIGTTVTAFIIGIKISEYALPIIAVGAALIFFIKNKKVNNIGQVIFGFGTLFYGLNTMGEGLKPLRELQAFADLTVSMSENPLLGVLIGTIFTAAVQSSSASIGLLQQLYDQGAMDLFAALPVLFGDNIGTTITAVLAAIGASVAAKRAALTHVIFNLIGTIIVLIIIIPFTHFIAYLAEVFALNRPMTIAFAHGIFNVSNTLIQLPFIGILAIIVTKLVPGDDFYIEYKAKHLDPRFVGSSPAIALGQAKQEVLRMAEFSEKGLLEVSKYMENGQKKHAEMAVQFEDAINNLDRKITEYLISISSRSLSAQDSKMHGMLMDTVRDIERIGDHIENIVELKDYQKANKVKISEKALHDLQEMFDLTHSTLTEAIMSLETGDLEAARSVIEKEEHIDQMERKLRKQHIIRVNEGNCTGAAGIVFVDIVSNLERIGDHSVNIAEAVIGENR
ncbi:Na/Pi cotransporter family protein [Halalkalibacterium halodurans]|uniref:Sodium-dependent phosphate transporter n=2 Tax=Halalkalibacterium halodurans TaxID=86665 RepID=A0A0M0KLU7_ALKHA|nr:Na/Pi cotransporter family protein [Halalkalibacterium halodurans]MDY7221931.1 Na/Pi cotransporter family protein [Halalkalibacterium halodurans]MDY7241207.1 Na/Pi cotransporter family protein [Halalkalibacterium halodurans]TES56700.1 Na/Pi cotransporter family protein [Halalkalibacterium halodurans]TPE69313.1 Na/Pi cotransporter family protein [Halalkalibacterium halodurans]